ncbi:hypothetical protein ACWD4G_16810 [Streptomyces sp. NPDC002643]
MKLLGMEYGVPGMKGTAPSHTPSVFSMAPIVWYEPPLPPQT